MSSISTVSKMGETEKKRKEIENLTKELAQKEEEMKNLKLKYAAATSRVVSIEKEIKENRASDPTKIKVILEKSENDNRLIDALKAEITKLQKSLNISSGKSGPLDVFFIKI